MGWDVCGISIPWCSTPLLQQHMTEHSETPRCLPAVTWGPNRLLGTGFGGRFCFPKFLWLPLGVFPVPAEQQRVDQDVLGSSPR